MNIEVRRVKYQAVEALRELYPAEARCQILCDGDLPRGLADSFLILLDGRTAGYGAVRNRIDAGRVTEFYALPEARAHALPLFRELLRASGAREIAAQTNMPSLLMLLLRLRDGHCDRVNSVPRRVYFGFEFSGRVGSSCRGRRA